MHVNMITTWESDDGIATYTAQIVDALRNRNVSVSIHPIKKRGSFAPLYFFKLGKQAAKDGKILHIQFEYGLFGKLGIWGVCFPLLALGIRAINTEIPVVLTIHEIGINETSPLRHFILRIARTPIDYALKWLGNKFIVHSKGSFEELIKRGVSPKNIVQVSHGVKKVMQSIPTKEEGKSKLGLQSKKVVTFFGFIKQSKGLDRLLDVASNLPEEYTIFVAGGAETKADEKYYQHLLSEYNDQKNIWFKGFVDDNEIPIIMAATDVLVLPYRSVTESGVFNLAISYHVCMLASPLPIFRQRERKYGCIKTVEMEDLKQFVKCIQALAESKVAQKKMFKGMDAFIRDHSLSTVAKEILMIYEEVISSKCL